MQSLLTREDLNQWLAENRSKKAILFKHSTTCPISAAAYREVEKFEQQSDAPIALVRVIEERPLSNAIAERFGVQHQSPQVLAPQRRQSHMA